MALKACSTLSLRAVKNIFHNRILLSSRQHPKTKCNYYCTAPNNESNLINDKTDNATPAKEALSAEIELYVDADFKMKSTGVIPGKGPPPELPTTCCGSGCANCVWIDYADQMADYYRDGGQKAWDAISQLEDPMLRAFLTMELKTMKR